MSEDEILESRKYTTVKHGFQSKIVLFKFVTDGTTCFVDMKIWRGVYRELFDLKEWKSKVAIQLSCVSFFVCCVVIVAVRAARKLFFSCCICTSGSELCTG